MRLGGRAGAEGLLAEARGGVAPDTVLSCSCISIMWSPNRMLKLSGALPHRNSFTWVSLSDSSACIMPISGRCV